MSGSIQNDQITTTLLEKASEFRALINANSFGLRDEIDASADMTACINELENLFRSLEQYSRSERDLRYIALVGHYSAGKSSTINSLLASNVRKVDLHPTDQGVTFIGHPDNAKKILPAESQGDLQVHVSLIENSVLNQTVLIDTPGTGDPSKVGAMVKDILPLASILLYLVNATIPFDESDLPNMKRIFDELGHIPFKFVITRSDVFRVNKEAAVSARNVDKLAQSKFAAKLIARLRSQGVALNFTENDIIFVDNDADFGIDELVNEVIHSDIDTNKIHINTLLFFMRRLKDTQKQLVTWSQKIDASVAGLLLKASENRAKFDENTGISTDALIRALATNHSDLSKRVKEDDQSIATWGDTNSLITGPNSPALDAFMATVMATFKSELADSLAAIVQQETDDMFRKYAMRKYDLHEADSDWREFDSRVDVDRIELSAGDIENAWCTSIISLSDRIVDHWENLVSEVLEEAREFEYRLDAFNDFLKNNSTPRSELGRFQEFEKTLQTAIFRFLETVKMYQVAVLAYRMKELAEHVSMGKALDELEKNNLDDEVIERIKKDLIDLIFNNRETIHSEFDAHRKFHRDQVVAIASTMNHELSALKAISKDLPLRANVATELQTKIDYRSLKEFVEKITLEHVKNQAKAFNDAVVSVIDEQVEKAGTATQVRLVRRTLLIRNVTIITAILGVLAIIGVWTSSASSFWGNLGNWIASAVFGVLFPIASGYLTTFLARKPSSINFTDGRRAVRAELLRARDELSLTFTGAEILHRLEEHHFADLRSGSENLFNEAQLSITAICKRLNTHVKAFELALKKFDEQMKITMNCMLEWHEPSDEKTGWIQNMSARIKELSIEPSFEVLRLKKTSVKAAADEIKAHDVNVGH